MPEMVGKKKAAARERHTAGEIRQREDRIAHFFFIRTLERPQIYDALRAECLNCLRSERAHADKGAWCRKFRASITPNRVSGLLMVQRVVARLCVEAKPEAILKLRRPLETQRTIRQHEDMRNELLDIEHDESMIEQQVVTPRDGVQTISVPRFTAREKIAAYKEARAINDVLCKLRGGLMEAVDDDEKGAPAPGEQAIAAQPYTFNFPNVKGSPKDLDTMIAMNIDRGKIN